MQYLLFTAALVLISAGGRCIQPLCYLWQYIKPH